MATSNLVSILLLRSVSTLDVEQPPAIRTKYEQLSSDVDSLTGKPISESLGVFVHCVDHPPGGKLYCFHHGALSSFDHTTAFPLVAIYGCIYDFYYIIGAHNSALGRPVTDVQDLPDGSRCAQFEGGHVHEIDGEAVP